MNVRGHGLVLSRGYDLGKVGEHGAEVVDRRASAMRARGRVLVAQRRAALPLCCVAALQREACSARHMRRAAP